LKASIIRQQSDFDQAFKSTCKTIEDQINTRVSQNSKSYRLLLEKEREHVSNLQTSLTTQDSSRLSAFDKSSEEKEKLLQSQLDTLKQKYDK
jgi:phage-related tail protein